MATADSVKAKLLELIAKANETTGNEDTNLTAAVDALIAGFGQGGGIPTPITAMTAGSITPTADSDALTIQHDLGVVPQCFVVYLTNAYAASENPGAIFGYCANYLAFPADGLATSSRQGVYFYAHPTSGNRLTGANRPVMNSSTVTVGGLPGTAKYVSTVVDENGETVPAIYHWVAMAFLRGVGNETL